MQRSHQFRKLRAVFRSPAVQGIAADVLHDIARACIIASGYLFLFAADNSHAHHLLWASVLAVDAVVASFCSVDLRGDAK